VAATFTLGDPAVYMAASDSGFVLPIKAADVGNMHANGLIFDPSNFSSGNTITAYEFVVYNGGEGPSGPATVSAELWTGDPLGFLDTTCGDPATAITGSACLFSDIPDGVMAPCAISGGVAVQPCAAIPHLRCELPSKVTINCDRVWLVWEAMEGCRIGWRLQGELGVAGSLGITPSEFGTAVQSAVAGDCGQFDACAASTENNGCAVATNGANCGTCCDNGGATANLPCDHTDGVLECAHATFCTDGTADTVLAADYAVGSGYYANYLATVYATPFVSIFAIPIGNAPDGADAGASPDFVNGAFVRNGNELVLRDANSDTWAFLEYRIEDWDPDETTDSPNDTLRAYLVTIDTSGFTSGAAGTLAGKRIPCPSDDRSVCNNSVGEGSDCDSPVGCHDSNGDGIPDPEDCECEFLYMDLDRGSPFDPLEPGEVPAIFADDLPGRPIPEIVTTAGYPDLIGFRFGLTLASPSRMPDPDPFPAGGMYLGTLVLDVPPDARGTFTIGMNPSNTAVTRATSDFIPLLGLRPALVTVEIGKCCRGIGSPSGPICEDGLLAKECTGPGAIFRAGEICTGNIYCDCYPCANHETCVDGNACTVDRCNPATCACTNTPVSGPGQCCVPGEEPGLVEDREGGGAVCTLDDGNSCTVDSCDAVGRCVHAPVSCPDDGIFCTGPEVCDLQLGCGSAGNPCTVPEDCNESANRCECALPMVLAAGDRYLEITPQPADSTIPMALVVRPGCAAALPKYVGMPSGPFNVAMLVDQPSNAALLTPVQWGTVYVAGETVVPDTVYEVQVDCRGPAGPALSTAVSVETPIWGDVVGQFPWQPPQGAVTIHDVTAILEAFRHSARAPSIYRADIWGCVPDQDPEIIDAVGALDGFRHILFTFSTRCPVPCP
jgi:hypothetical protein